MNIDIKNILINSESETVELKSGFNTDAYQSSTRNKLLAEAFYLTKDIENMVVVLLVLEKLLQNTLQ